MNKIVNKVNCFPHIRYRGILAEVYGLGILILNDSKMESNEIGLELIHKNHRLVSCNVVNIHCEDENVIIGTRVNNNIDYCIYIQGLGIINMSYLFKDNIVMKKEIQLVVKIEENNSEGISAGYAFTKKYIELGGIKIPFLCIIIESEQDIPSLIENIALSEKTNSIDIAVK
jgi:HPr kinase/phosphorylase